MVKTSGKIMEKWWKSEVSLSFFPVFSKLQSWDWGIEDIFKWDYLYKATKKVEVQPQVRLNYWELPYQKIGFDQNKWQYQLQIVGCLTKKIGFRSRNNMCFFAQKVRIERGGLTDNNWKVLMDKNVDGVHEPKKLDVCSPQQGCEGCVLATRNRSVHSD